MSEKQIEPAYAATMPAPQGGALPTGLEWSALERMANTLADSDVIPYRLKRKPADVAVILLAAREYGIPPLMALSKLPVVNGTPAPMGELMVALVLRAGHRIRVTVTGLDDWATAAAVCTTRRRDEDDDDVLTFTFAEAQAAGLVDLVQGKPSARDQKGNPTPWKQYPANMLRWRAVANACRLRFPDVLLGMSYLPEELGAIVDADGAPIRGEVVDTPRPKPPAGSLEERTAREAADRLADFVGPVEVLDNVLAHAEDNGYADTPLEYADRQTGERAATLREAITLHREWLGTNTVDVVDADVVETPEEAPAEAPTPPASPQAVEDPRDAAHELAREALNTDDPDYLRAIYKGAGELRALDVLPVLGDDDLDALGAPHDLDTMALGAFLVAAGDYVAKHGTAIRDVMGPRPTEPTPEVEDPWAADAAAGWPTTPAPEQ